LVGDFDGAQRFQQTRSVSAGDAKEAKKKIDFPLASWFLSQNMQGRSNLTLLDITEKVANCFNRPCAIRQVGVPTRMLQRLTNLTLKLDCPAWIKAKAVGVFFQQTLDPF
jgi:hypothetical protein